MSENVAVAAAAPKPSLRTWWILVKTSAASWVDDYAASMGAALSYYTVFSIAPLLLIVVSVAGLVFGPDAVRGALFAQLQGLMGDDAAKAVQGLLASVNKPSQGIIGTVVGIALLLFGATTVFGELQDSLDRIWRAPARQKGGLWSLLRARLLSFGMILGLAFLLMVSLVVGAAIAALGNWWGPAFGSWEVLLQIVNLLVGFVLTTVVFAMIYKMMPRVHVRWRDVWTGAIVTSLLFTIGKFLIGLYIGKSGVASGFGAAGSLVVVFIWVYYSAQIFFLGAEFTWVYAKTLGSLRGREGLAEVTKKAAQDGGVPSRSEGSPPAPTAADAKSEVRDRPRGDPISAWGEVGAGVAFFVALRFLLPRLLRRF